MNTDQYEIELLTDTLCHGADPRQAELRVPSIRGQLRCWHTILWGEQSTKDCWGVVPPDEKDQTPAQASKVVIRMESAGKFDAKPVNILPHHGDKGKTFSNGIPSRTQFRLTVSYRYLKPEDVQSVRNKVNTAIQIWLMLGTLGLRGSRAFGSVWDKNCRYNTPEEFLDAVSTVLKNSSNGKSYAVHLLRLEAQCSGNKLMTFCTDTIGGHPDLLGGIKPTRQVSPLKMKFVKINGMLYLALHAKDKIVLERAEGLLKANKKPVGKSVIVGRV